MIVLALGLALTFVTAACLASLLRLQSGVAFLLAVTVLSCGELVAVSHLLSILDAYSRVGLVLMLAGVATCAAAAVAFARPPRPSFALRATVRHLVADPVLAALATVAGLAFIYIAALALLTPPSENDSLAYHVTRAALWVQQGSLAAIPGGVDYRINEFPRNAELVQSATMLLSGDVRWVGLVQLGGLVTATLAIYGCALRLGLDRRAAAFGALLFPTLPIVALQTPLPKNDVVVAALVVTAVYFLLGRSWADVALATVTIVLLAGTKLTALFALPALFAVAVLGQRPVRQRLVAGAAVIAGGALGLATVLELRGRSRDTGGEAHGGVGGPLDLLARVSRYAIETVELPGASGRNVLVYLAPVLVLGVAALVRRRGELLAAAGLTVLVIGLLPLENLLRRVYWRGWNLLGEDKALELGAARDATVPSGVQSWYGPVGLGATLVAIALVVHAVRRGTLPVVSLVLASAPLALLAASATGLGYHAYSGRYVMGGVALSAATWGLLRSWTPVPVAIVAIAATVVTVSLLLSTEKPSGFDLLRSDDRASIWRLDRAWAQNDKPELAPVTLYVDTHAQVGSTIAVVRDATAYPAVYLGWPGIDHRLAFANTLPEARSKDAQWAVLTAAARCSPEWAKVVDSPPWALWRRTANARCGRG